MSWKIAKLRRVLAKKVWLYRKLRGWSQEALAASADLDCSYIGRIERERVNISLDNLGKLANGLQIPAHELVSPVVDFDRLEAELSECFMTKCQ